MKAAAPGSASADPAIIVICSSLYETLWSATRAPGRWGSGRQVIVGGVITRSDVDAAERRIAGRVRRTPVLAVDTLPGRWFKCEFLQHAGRSRRVERSTGCCRPRSRARLPPASSSPPEATPASPTPTRPPRVGAGDVFVPRDRAAGQGGPAARVGRDRRPRGAEYAVASEAAAEFASAKGRGALPCVRPAGGGRRRRHSGTELVASCTDRRHVMLAVGGGGLMAGRGGGPRRSRSDRRGRAGQLPHLHAAMVQVDRSTCRSPASPPTRSAPAGWGNRLRRGRAHRGTGDLVSDDDILAARRICGPSTTLWSSTGAAAAMAALVSTPMFLHPESGSRSSYVELTPTRPTSRCAGVGPPIGRPRPRYRRSPVNRCTLGRAAAGRS